MRFTKRLLLGFLFTCLFASVLKAQEGELTLDPNDIPLTPEPTLEVPADNTVTVPNLDVQPPVDPGGNTGTPLVEVVKPTPSNLEVISDHKANGSDAVKEEKFAKAYAKFHKDSTSEQNWEKVVGKRTADTYTVNKGDTLWDISGTLFGDPFYWPKIWSLNKDLIYNPHVIFPDMKIKFYQGNSKMAPTLATDNRPGNGAAASTLTKSDMASDSKVENESITSAPKQNIMSTTLRKLPKFFRDHQVRVAKQVDIQIEEAKLEAVESMIKLEFYVAEEPLASAGQVVEVEFELKSAAENQFVFVKFSEEPSGLYTVVKPGKTIKEDKDATMSAEIHEVEGELKILGKVNTEDNVYRAQVIRSNTLISKGSLLVPGKMKTFKLTDALKETTALKGRIIGNLHDYGIVGQGSFVLLNQGTQSGYQADMKLPIYEDLTKRNAGSYVKENPQKVGTLVIADVTQNFSIGYIDRIYNPVMVLDFVGMSEASDPSPKTASAKEEDAVEVEVDSPAQSQEINTDDF